VPRYGYTTSMSSLMNKVSRFARSPQGKKFTAKAMEVAKDPKTKAKVEQFRRKRAQGH